MIDHEVNRHQRIDHRRIPALSLEGRAHGGEIDDRGHSCEVLEDHPCRGKGELTIIDRLLPPRTERLHLLFRCVLGAGGSDQVLEKDLYGHGDAVELGYPSLLEGLQAEVIDGSGLRLERRAAPKGSCLGAIAVMLP